MVPMEIGNIASLTNLWLENNMLSGDLPASLDNLTNLERVQIIGGENNFSGCIPAALANAGITDTADTDLPMSARRTTVRRNGTKTVRVGNPGPHG